MKGRNFSFEQFYRALADQTRLRVINLLETDELCVCLLVEALQTNQSKISRHLSYLRRAGLVAARREGKWVLYRLLEPKDVHVAEIFRGVRNGLNQDLKMRQDRERLAKLRHIGAFPSPVQSGKPGLKNLSRES